MASGIQTQADELAAALSEAVAGLLAVDVSDVQVTVAAPGLDDVAGPFHVELRAAAAPDEASSEPQVSTDADESTDVPQPTDEVVTPEQLDEEADAAADFLEGLLDAMDLPGDLRIHVLDDHAEVEIAEIGSGALIGRRGQTLDAIQELVRCALQRQFQRRARVLVDAEGYRARRLEKLREKAEEAIDRVLDSGEEVRLEPMDVFERKAVHQVVAEVDGVASKSLGREPGRRVVVVPE